MHLLPVGSEASNWTNDHWFEKAGHPPFDGCWICPGPTPLPEVAVPGFCETSRGAASGVDPGEWPMSVTSL